MDINKSKTLRNIDNEIMALIEASNMSAKGDFRSRANAESPERVARAKSLDFSRFRDVKIDSNGQATIRFETASSSYGVDGETYINLVTVPGLLSAYKESPTYTTIAGALKNSDVKVNCNCKDFKMRYEYWLNKDGDLSRVGGEEEQYAINNAPNVTNPNNNKGPFCKHLIAVTGVFLANMSNISVYMKGIDVDNVNEDENIDSVEDNITLKKEDNEFVPAIIDNAGGDIDEALDKDKGLTESEKEEVKVALTKDENPESLDIIEEQDEEDISEPVDIIEEPIEEEREDDEVIDIEDDDDIELEKDKNPLDANDL